MYFGIASFGRRLDMTKTNRTPQEILEYIGRSMFMLKFADMKASVSLCNAPVKRLESVFNIAQQIDVYRSMVSSDTFLSETQILQFRQREIAKTAQVLLALNQANMLMTQDLLSPNTSKIKKDKLRHEIAKNGESEVYANLVFNHLTASYVQDYGRKQLLSLPYVGQLLKQNEKHQKEMEKTSLKERLIDAQNEQKSMDKKGAKLQAQPVLTDEVDVIQPTSKSQSNQNN